MTNNRSPKELIQIYWDRIWNNREVELIREICADPIVRHDPKSVTALSHDEQVARVLQQSEAYAPYFTHEVLLGDDTYVASVWNMVTRKGDSIELSGIEVFKVVDGRFTDCWNSSYSQGLWGRQGDPSVALDEQPAALLTSVAAIDNEWLQRVFRDAGESFPRISLTRIKPVGNGNLSNTVQVEITYNADASGAPGSVICKFDAENPQARELGAAFGTSIREIKTYEMFGVEPPLRIPHIFRATSDVDGQVFNLVLEDLSPKAIAGDQIKGCSCDEARAAVDELANLHRAYWQRQDFLIQPWLMQTATAPSALFDQIYRAGLAIFQERFRDRLSADAFKTIEALQDVMGRWRTMSTKYPTIIHGDPRVDNIFFEHGSKGILAYLIDWQFTGVGDAQFDLAYFLTGSLSPADRRYCEKDLIAMHSTKIRTVDSTYTDEVALQAYRLNIVAGLFNTIGAATGMPSTPHNDALLLTLAERNCEAVKDWDGVGAVRNAVNAI